MSAGMDNISDFSSETFTRTVNHSLKPYPSKYSANSEIQLFFIHIRTEIYISVPNKNDKQIKFWETEICHLKKKTEVKKWNSSVNISIQFLP